VAAYSMGWVKGSSELEIVSVESKVGAERRPTSWI